MLTTIEDTDTHDIAVFDCPVPLTVGLELVAYEPERKVVVTNVLLRVSEDQLVQQARVRTKAGYNLNFWAS